jgi:hypothetical protein
MASSSTTLVRFQNACVTCVRGGRRFFERYRDFLLDPGTIFTLMSMLLLILAIIVTPDGVINSAHASTWLYLASALVGSSYIWWSAIQGIRERDFTADIPVSSASILPPRSLLCSYSWVACWKSLSLPGLVMPWILWQHCSLTQ